jgi:enoyl-CoA hydratase/carnithine racemase
MILSGDRIPAKEALRIGLVNHVVGSKQLLPAARVLATRIAGRRHEAVSLGKAVIDRGWEAPLASGLLHEELSGWLCFSAEKMHRETRAFVERGKKSRHRK